MKPTNEIQLDQMILTTALGQFGKCIQSNQVNSILLNLTSGIVTIQTKDNKTIYIQSWLAAYGQ